MSGSYSIQWSRTTHRIILSRTGSVTATFHNESLFSGDEWRFLHFLTAFKFSGNENCNVWWPPCQPNSSTVFNIEKFECQIIKCKGLLQMSVICTILCINNIDWTKQMASKLTSCSVLKIPQRVHVVLSNENAAPYKFASNLYRLVFMVFEFFNLVSQQLSFFNRELLDLATQLCILLH